MTRSSRRRGRCASPSVPRSTSSGGAGCVRSSGGRRDGDARHDLRRTDAARRAGRGRGGAPCALAAARSGRTRRSGRWRPDGPFSARRRRREAEAALPDAIELLVLCVHAGRSPVQAVLEVGARARRRCGERSRPSSSPCTGGARSPTPSASSRAASARGPESWPAPWRWPTATASRWRRCSTASPTTPATRRRLGEAAARRLPVHLSFPLVMCTLPSFVLLAIAPAVLGALSTLRAPAP